MDWHAGSGPPELGLAIEDADRPVVSLVTADRRPLAQRTVFESAFDIGDENAASQLHIKIAGRSPMGDIWRSDRERDNRIERQAAGHGVGESAPTSADEQRHENERREQVERLPRKPQIHQLDPDETD
jgi:hypothetical protein